MKTPYQHLEKHKRKVWHKLEKLDKRMRKHGEEVKYMNITEIVVRGLGLLLLIVGVIALISMLFPLFGLSVVWWVALIAGLIFIAVGLVLIRGGNITL